MMFRAIFTVSIMMTVNLVAAASVELSTMTKLQHLIPFDQQAFDFEGMTQEEKDNIGKLNVPRNIFKPILHVPRICVLIFDDIFIQAGLFPSWCLGSNGRVS